MSKDKKQFAIIIIGIIIVVLLVAVLVSNLAKSKNNSAGASNGATSEAIANNESNKKTAATSVWATAPTTLNDFEYKLDVVEKSITLTHYKGNENKIWVSGSYEVDKDDYSVRLEDATFLFDTKITSVILGEGVTYAENNTFNSCTNLQYLYLPSTLSPLTDSYSLFDYLDDVLKYVYFGGTEEQWQVLCAGVNSGVLNRFHVYCNSSMSELDNNQIEINGTQLQ
jgi:hypothetical protein